MFFFCQKKKAYGPKFTKNNILLTENDNLIFVFVKFANCDNWIFSPESPVEKYVYFQAFTSCLSLQNFQLWNDKPKKNNGQ